MPLDIAPLANAIDRLRKGLARHKSEPLDEPLRDGLIQRFEFTYELGDKTLRRYLQEQAASSEEAAGMSFAELIRAGNAQGPLRAEWPTWRHLRAVRTRTIHTYDSETAAAVAAEIPKFLEDAEYLCTPLRQRTE